MGDRKYDASWKEKPFESWIKVVLPQLHQEQYLPSCFLLKTRPHWQSPSRRGEYLLLALVLAQGADPSVGCPLTQTHIPQQS